MDGWMDGCADFDSKQGKDVRRHLSHAFLRGREEARRMDKLVYFSLFLIYEFLYRCLYHGICTSYCMNFIYVEMGAIGRQ